MPSPRSVAIACQGGGSHCAFGAGVLHEILGALEASGGEPLITRAGERYRIAGFSGTSGGAINALFGWYALVAGDGRRGGEALSAFWHDMMASDFWDAFMNIALVASVRLQGVLPTVELPPNPLSRQSQIALGEMIARHLPFAALPALLRDDGPELHIGAVNVRSGEFEAFGGCGRQALVGVDHVLASAAVPELFPPVQVDGQYYWDGLLSQNPPIRDFLRGRDKSRIPDEIWVVRINPRACADVPTGLNGIRDRRNELAGNLALEEETYFIGQVNRWVDEGLLPGKKHVEVREISLQMSGYADDGFDYASKLDRRPAFIENLMARGRSAAERFLRGEEGG